MIRRDDPRRHQAGRFGLACKLPLAPARLDIVTACTGFFAPTYRCCF
jgi:hypothetical protein